MGLITIAEALGRLYYHVTAYVPRKLPATPAQYERFKSIMIHAFGLPDEPQIWVLVSGQISSSPPHRLRKPWGHIANAAKKLAVMNLAAGYRSQALQQLNDKLEAAVNKVKADVEQEEAANAEKAAQELAQAGAQSPAGSPQESA